jgi:copper oxidase (laccase) domain-containing protein
MYQLPELTKYLKLLHAFSEASEGNMSFRWGSAEGVVGHRREFLGKLGIALDSCVGTLTNHGVEVCRVGKEQRGGGMAGLDGAASADAFLTDVPGLPLFLLTADCLPIIFYDPARAVAGIAHASRHNTPKYIVREVVMKMREWYETLSHDIVVGIGPGARKESYQFSPEVCAALAPVWGAFAEGCALDVAGWSVAQLIESGVRRESIFISPCDTITDPRFFSHARSARAGEAEGRFATVVGVRE